MASIHLHVIIVRAVPGPTDLPCLFFFFNDTATTEIYTLSLHDALPIYHVRRRRRFTWLRVGKLAGTGEEPVDRKSTRLNSSHDQISYAVFCLKKKKNHALRLDELSSIPTLNSSDATVLRATCCRQHYTC